MVRQATNYSPMKSTVRRPNAQNIRRRTIMDVDPIFDPRLVYQDIPDFLGIGPSSPPKRSNQRPPIIIRRPPTIAPPLPVVRRDIAPPLPVVRRNIAPPLPIIRRDIAPPLPVVRRDPVGYSETVYNYDLDAPVPKKTVKKVVRVRIKKEKAPVAKPEPVECPRPGCGKKFLFQKVLDKHLENHDVERERKVHTCPHCQKTITTLYRYKIHVRIHTGEKPFYCEFCKEGFSDPRIHKVHMKRHEGQILYKPRVPVDPREEKVVEVKREVPKPENPLKFKCTQKGCKKKFTCNYKLQAHIRLHTGEKPYVCSECSSPFRTSTQLNLHYRLHSGEKPYQCEKCPSAYPRLDSLKYHMKVVHGMDLPKQKSRVVDPSQVSLTDDGPSEAVTSSPKKKRTYMKTLVCPHDGCDETFTLKSSLDKHICTHTGEKPYVCEECKKGFTTAYVLKVHMREHTGDKPYRCDKCPEMFSRSDKLRRHLKKHVGEKKVNCGICGEMFETNEEKSEHVLEKHMPMHLRLKREAILSQKAAEDAQKAAEEAQKEAEKAEKEAAEAERLANEEAQNLQDPSNAPLVGTSGPAFQWN